MNIRPTDISRIGQKLDHPESVCVEADGTVYAGGEAGQIYRITPEGGQEEIATTGGNILGVELDGRGRVYVCDYERRGVFRVDTDGLLSLLSAGTDTRRMVLPNHLVFDRHGNLYVSDSGDYWAPSGTGCIFVVRPDGGTEVFHAGPFRYANGLAIDPSEEWLYVAQSAAWNIVRIPLGTPNGRIEKMCTLRDHVVPDGLGFSAAGTLLIACYRPDHILTCDPGGRVEVLCSDPTAELLIAPTDVCLHAGKLYVANLGGYHISVLDSTMRPGPIHRPTF